MIVDVVVEIQTYRRDLSSHEWCVIYLSLERIHLPTDITTNDRHRI